MKTNKFLAIAFTALFLSFTGLEASAQTEAKKAEAPALTLHQMKPMLFRATYTNPEGGRIYVKILDASKTPVFAENAVSKSPYTRFFDLSTLNDGQYTIEVIDGKKVFSETIDITTKTQRVITAKN